MEGAETLAYLIEEDANLQTLASISDHIIKTLADYLRYTSVQQINTRSTNRKVKTIVCNNSISIKLTSLDYLYQSPAISE